jgi:hypothetical protein
MKDLNEVYRNSGLGKWFHDESAGGKPGWDRYNSKGQRVGECGDAKKGEPYAACLSKQKAAKLGKEKIGSFVERKRAAQSAAGRGKKGSGKKGKKPINVDTGIREEYDVDKKGPSMTPGQNMDIDKRNKRFKTPPCAIDNKEVKMPEYEDYIIGEEKTPRLNKPMKGDVKKFKVYVKNEKGNIVKVNFGDKNMSIKRDNPARRKNFRARHSCDDNPGPKTKARYWSCQMWRADKSVGDMLREAAETQEIIDLIEKNVPKKPKKWSACKAQAKKKFDVYPCVPMDSLAITKTGPQSYENLTVGDEILSYNIQNDELEWKPILNLHHFENAPLVEMGKATGFKIKCTPNHKWAIKHGQDYSKTSLIETKDINKHMQIITCATLNDYHQSVLENWSKKDSWVEKVLNMSKNEREIYLASAIVYDGHDQGVSTKISNRHTFGFSQKNEDHFYAAILAAFLNGYHVSFSDKGLDIQSACIIRNKKTHNTQNLIIEEVDSEDVWCPETENGTWVMIQNGFITITGNSAYANAWAAKCYKKKGGKWKSVSEQFAPYIDSMQIDSTPEETDELNNKAFKPEKIENDLPPIQRNKSGKKFNSKSLRLENFRNILKKKLNESANNVPLSLYRQEFPNWNITSPPPGVGVFDTPNYYLPTPGMRPTPYDIPTGFPMEEPNSWLDDNGKPLYYDNKGNPIVPPVYPGDNATEQEMEKYYKDYLKFFDKLVKHWQNWANNNGFSALYKPQWIQDAYRQSKIYFNLLNNLNLDLNVNDPLNLVDSGYSFPNSLYDLNP